MQQHQDIKESRASSEVHHLSLSHIPFVKPKALWMSPQALLHSSHSSRMLSVSRLHSRSLSIRCVYFFFISALLPTSWPYKVLENRNRITQDVDDILKALSGIETLYESSELQVDPSPDIAIPGYGVFEAVRSLYECVISTTSVCLVFHSFFFSIASFGQ